MAGKIGIVGAGSVGATIAYACMVRGIGKHISLYDVVKSRVDAEVLDLNHGLMFVPMATVDGSDDINVMADCNVIVIAAGARQKPGQSRIELAGINAEMCRTLIPDLLRVAPDARILMVTTRSTCSPTSRSRSAASPPAASWAAAPCSIPRASAS